MLVVSIRDDDYHDLVKNIDQSYLLRGKFSNITNNLRNTLEELLEDAISSEELDKIMYDDFLSCETPLDALTGKILILVFLFVMSLPFLHSLRKNSKGMRKLKKQHGSDFNMFCEKVDAEMKSPNALKQGAVTITQNYIIANSPCTFFVLPIDELMWVYKGTITYYRIIHKTNITFVFGNKAKYQITSMKKINVDNIIKYFSQEEYKCIVGYSDELDKLYRKQPDVLIDKWKNSDNQ
jgi:hypothetical protein